eukprot:3326004-Rhodomonas_salina.1
MDHHKVMSLDAELLAPTDDGDDRAVIYNGPPERVFNFILDSYKVDITPGTRLHLCRRQSPVAELVGGCTGKKRLRVHFKLVGRKQGHLQGHARCACKCCLYEWTLGQDNVCNCEP